MFLKIKTVSINSSPILLGPTGMKIERGRGGGEGEGGGGEGMGGGGKNQQKQNEMVMSLFNFQVSLQTSALLS